MDKVIKADGRLTVKGMGRKKPKEKKKGGATICTVHHMSHSRAECRGLQVSKPLDGKIKGQKYLPTQRSSDTM